MTVGKNDLAILDKFGFKRLPVGVKYTFTRPENIARLDENMTLCTMLKRAQEGEPFYADKNNLTCGTVQLGGGEHGILQSSGIFGAELKSFEEPRTSAKLYPRIPLIKSGLANYISFAPLGKISFDPDVMIIFTDTVNQLQILLRAVCWRTAEVWESKFTNVLGCAWMFAYPYLSDKVNWGMTGLSHGMGRRNIFPDGIPFVAIPYLRLPSVLQALREVPWVLPSFEDDKFFDRTRARLDEELPKHIVQ